MRNDLEWLIERYRAIARELPDAALDCSVLAAARAKHLRGRRTRQFALAASLIIGIALVAAWPRGVRPAAKHDTQAGLYEGLVRAASIQIPAPNSTAHPLNDPRPHAADGVAPPPMSSGDAS